MLRYVQVFTNDEYQTALKLAGKTIETAHG